MNKTEILNLKFASRDLGKECSIRDFLKELLITLWQEEEMFSGKRPFGNSGWKSDIEKTLIENKIISGKFDEDYYIEEYDDEKSDKLMKKLINHIFKEDENK